jgi:hypothetical protein
MRSGNATNAPVASRQVFCASQPYPLGQAVGVPSDLGLQSRWHCAGSPRARHASPSRAKPSQSSPTSSTPLPQTFAAISGNARHAHGESAQASRTARAPLVKMDSPGRSGGCRAGQVAPARAPWPPALEVVVGDDPKRLRQVTRRLERDLYRHAATLERAARTPHRATGRRRARAFPVVHRGAEPDPLGRGLLGRSRPRHARFLWNDYRRPRGFAGRGLRARGGARGRRHADRRGWMASAPSAARAPRHLQSRARASQGHADERPSR